MKLLKLYHGTSYDNCNKIIKEGLKKNSSLTTNISIAKDHAIKKLLHKLNKNSYIIEFLIPEDLVVDIKNWENEYNNIINIDKHFIVNTHKFKIKEILKEKIINISKEDLLVTLKKLEKIENKFVYFEVKNGNN